MRGSAAVKVAQPLRPAGLARRMSAGTAKVSCVPIDQGRTTSGGQFEERFDRITQSLRQEGRYRIFQNVNRIAGGFPRAVWYDSRGEQKQDVITWCTNDYLGMGQARAVTESMHFAISKYGCGSGGTRNISGTNQGHVDLEIELADLHGKESALIFSSCYVANDALLSVLPDFMPGVHIFSDEGNHASIIQGIKHASQSPNFGGKAIYKHNDLQHLASLMKAAPKSAPKIVAFESVYSMSGTTSDIGATCDVASQFGALTFIDEVRLHATYGRLHVDSCDNRRFTPLDFMAKMEVE